MESYKSNTSGKMCARKILKIEKKKKKKKKKRLQNLGKIGNTMKTNLRATK